MLGSVALGADEDADDAGVAVARRRVQRRVPVVVLDVRPAAAEQEHLQPRQNRVTSGTQFRSSGCATVDSIELTLQVSLWPFWQQR